MSGKFGLSNKQVIPMQVVLAAGAGGDQSRNRLDVSGLGLSCSASDCISYADLKVRLSQKPRAELVLVFLSPAAPADGLNAIRTARNFSLPVVAVGPSVDAQVIIQATRLGAQFV